MTRASYLDAMQGASEARTETYREYVKGVLKLATRQGAKSRGGAAGSASRQVAAVRSSG